MSVMKDLLSAFSRLSRLGGGQARLDLPTLPSYREVIADYLRSLESDTDITPEVDRDTPSYRRRAMTSNFSR